LLQRCDESIKNTGASKRVFLVSVDLCEEGWSTELIERREELHAEVAGDEFIK
jgi:hypothetical protein